MPGYVPLVAVDPPGRAWPGSCNCACDVSPALVVRLGTSQCSQATRLCAAHAQELSDLLRAFLLARLGESAFKRRGPRIVGL